METKKFSLQTVDEQLSFDTTVHCCVCVFCECMHNNINSCKWQCGLDAWNVYRACLDQVLIAIRSYTLLCDHNQSKTRLIVIMNLIAKLGIIYATAWHASLCTAVLDCLSVSCHCRHTQPILYTVFQKNAPPLACYIFDAHEWILIFFGRNVTDKVGNQNTLYYATSNNLCFCTTWQNLETWKSHLTQLDCVTYTMHLCAIFLKEKIVICDVCLLYTSPSPRD